MIYYELTSTLLLTGANPSYTKLNLGNAGELFGVVNFALEGVGLIFPIRSSLKRVDKFRKLFHSVSIVIMVWFLVFGIVCSMVGAFSEGNWQHGHGNLLVLLFEVEYHRLRARHDVQYCSFA